MSFWIPDIPILIAFIVAFSVLRAAAQPKERTELTVFAAVCGNEVFKTLEKDFEGNNPHYSISFNLAGSQRRMRHIAEEFVRYVSSEREQCVVQRPGFIPAITAY